MTAAVVWLVVWFLLTFVMPSVLAGLGNVGFVAAVGEDAPWLAAAGVLLWIGAVGFFIFSAVQTVLQVISIIQLI